MAAKKGAENRPSHNQERSRRAMEPEVIVLASGGIDSAALLAMYKNLRRPIAAMFVDYSQPAHRQESKAVSAVCRALGVQLISCTWCAYVPKSSGLILGRNGFLLLSALMEAPRTVTTIAIGIHAGTPYPDCTPLFIETMQRTFELYGSKVTIAAPFVNWTKPNVIAFANEAGVPLNCTYSCEAGGDDPCGLCASCLDRETLDVGATR